MLRLVRAIGWALIAVATAISVFAAAGLIAALIVYLLSLVALP